MGGNPTQTQVTQVYRSVRLRAEVYEELVEKVPGKTISDKIEHLLKVYSEYRFQKVRKYMCNDRSLVRAALTVWVKWIGRDLGYEYLEEALSYLRPNGDDMVVDKAKCTETREEKKK